MKIFLTIIMAAFLLNGCMGTKDYYKAQIAYYEAQERNNEAHIAAMNNRQPLAEMVAPDGTRFVVHQTAMIPMPAIRTTQNPIVEGLKTVVNSTPLAIVAGGWTAKELIQNATGDINASGNAQVTNTSNSNNPTDIRSADEDIIEDHSNNSDNSDNSDNSMTNPDPLVVDPVIVEQPEYNDPVILRPEVVRPEVVQTGGE